MAAKDLKEFTLSDFRPYFTMCLKDAAKQLGVCNTMLKNLCRKNNIVNWPFRKLSAVQKALEVVRQQCNANCHDAGGCAHEGRIKDLQETIERINENPNEIQEVVGRSGKGKGGGGAAVGKGGSGSKASTAGSHGGDEVESSSAAADPFLRILLQARSGSSGKRRRGADSAIPVVPLSHFLDEFARECPPAASEDDGEGSPQVALVVAALPDTLRVKRRRFQGPMMLPPLVNQPPLRGEAAAGKCEPPVILMEPRVVDIVDIMLPPSLLIFPPAHMTSVP